MALGIWHDRVNLVLGSLVTGSMLGLEVETKKVVCFTFGWLFATLIFGPDSDIIPKRRAQWLRFILMPYSFLSRHRGLSHHFFWGTFLRNIYLLIIFYLLSFLVSFFSFISQKQILASVLMYLEFKMFFWFLIGQWFSDFIHLLTDKAYDKLFGRY